MVLANTLALARSEHNAYSGLTTKNDPLGRIIFRPLAENEIHPDSSIVAVAGGPSKLKAIRAALQAKLIDVIVTDHVTATELLNKV
jgi:Putative sugar-binding domain